MHENRYTYYKLSVHLMSDFMYFRNGQVIKYLDDSSVSVMYISIHKARTNDLDARLK